ncbi:MAG: dolichyl-phosphate beta-D-mannosyltransferase [Flavobacteriales bacterium]|nr:dolichyl-phosphate beta-D-mannosyltransferase [Flavobacteriales bacterium]|tara:strand:+ start:3319 stop:4041 length:723 start_codon:yes stop_codon:yes gene_type:complete
MPNSLVIIPTYNEIENIEKMLDTVMSLERPFDVLIVDDGSPDGTAEKVREKMSQYKGRIHMEERTGKLGLGTAYIHGFKWALARDYDYIFEMDCDFSHNPEDLPRLQEACEQGAGVAIGSRYVRGVNVVNWPMSRVLLSYFASVYVRFITGMPIQDSTAGFKCYRRSTLESIDFSQIQFVGYAFQIEMKFTAWRKGIEVVEVPVIFTDRTKGESKMSGGIIKEAIFGVIKLKLRSFFTKA